MTLHTQCCRQMWSTWWYRQTWSSWWPLFAFSSTVMWGLFSWIWKNSKDMHWYPQGWFCEYSDTVLFPDSLWIPWAHMFWTFLYSLQCAWLRNGTISCLFLLPWLGLPTFFDSNHLHPSLSFNNHSYWSSLFTCFLSEKELIPAHTIWCSLKNDLDPDIFSQNLRMHMYGSPYVFTAQIISVCVKEGSLALALSWKAP